MMIKYSLYDYRSIDNFPIIIALASAVLAVGC